MKLPRPETLTSAQVAALKLKLYGKLADRAEQLADLLCRPARTLDAIPVPPQPDFSTALRTGRRPDVYL